jgi:hypothetical protein
LSYDIDGDGSVSIEDFKAARKMDKDGKGYLEDQERERCIRELIEEYGIPKNQTDRERHSSHI